MVPLASTVPELDAQLSDLLEDFCPSSAKQEVTSLLPSAMCEHCQHQLLEAYKFKQRVKSLQDFQIAFLEARQNNEPEQLRELFRLKYASLNLLFRELNLMDHERALRWEDLISCQEENEEVIEPEKTEDLEIIDDEDSDDRNPQILHVELVDNVSSDEDTYNSENSMHVEVEYLDVEQTEADEENPPPAEVKAEQTFNNEDSQLLSHSEDSLEYLSFDQEQQTEWKCNIADCDQRFEEKEALLLHKQVIHQCCVCTICGSVLKNKYSLDNHTRRHMGRPNFACEYCPSTFYTSQEHKLHLSLVHIASKTAKCDLCGLEFKNKTCLKRHLKSHSDVRTYQCPFCEKAFKTNMHLHRHKETIHMKIRFKCTHCDASYGRKDKLRMHIERAHNIQMYFLCNICLKSFATEEQRLEHMSHHENPKPLECGVCLTAFLTSKDFKKHLCISYRKDYVCCKRDFKFHTFYNKHMFLVHGQKTNARVKPASNQLIANMRAERRQDERCAKCEKTFRTRKQKNAHKEFCRGKLNKDSTVEFILPNSLNE
ncbi:AAEL009187-PA [Aedes aegypti]|uniref:AAEL009187-PA n=1 Tax=Aedes aegypti TaxID=7159 RepID=Q16WM0_AEDAE|nr:AAEL009187-PA [Aedes aegypti]